MLNKLSLVPPVEIALGTRFDQAVDRKTGRTIQKLVTETFQYIPVLEVIKVVMTGQVRQLVDSEKKVSTRIPHWVSGWLLYGSAWIID